ncbi:MAG: FG-GAP repeat protein, partial [Vicinamibacterales bacterium]|nr:FG-GAP repeat protein [Vicinamibacterales bacterium]
MLRFRPLQAWALPALVCSLLAPAALAAHTSVGTTILTVPGGAPGDAFGRSVAISGDTLVVGAPGDDERGENAGAAYVFVRQPAGEWRLQQKVMSWSQRRDDWFGWSVGVDTNTLVVGSPGTQEWRGGAYVFERDDDGRWTERVHLLPDEVLAGDRFGWRVALDDDTLIASAPWRAVTGGDTTTRPGGLWFFRRSGTAWAIEQAVFGGAGEMLGFSLDIERDTVVAG